MRGKQFTKATVSTRITVPISRAFYLSAVAGNIIKEAHEFGITIEKIINHLRDGTYDEAVMTSTLDHEDGWKVEVCIDGQWYLVEVDI